MLYYYHHIHSTYNNITTRNLLWWIMLKVRHLFSACHISPCFPPPQLPYCSDTTWLCVSACLRASHLSFLFKKLKSASYNRIVQSLSTLQLLDFFSIIQFLYCLHLLGDYPVVYGIFVRVASTFERYSLLLTAFA